jgi:hypothetical protein
MPEFNLAVFRLMQFAIVLALICAVIIVSNDYTEMRMDGYFIPTLVAALWTSLVYKTEIRSG